MVQPDPVAAARGWLGTPFAHQASCRGAGADCLGLIRGLWRDCLGAEPASVPAYAPGEGDLLPALHAHLTRREGDLRPGDIVLFRMQPGQPARHLGLLSTVTPPAFIHAWSGLGVCETRLSSPWARRIVARFAFYPTILTQE